MTFLLDANVLIHAVSPTDRRPGCEQIVDAVAAGAAAGRTSTAVLEEVWHIELSNRIGLPGGTTARLYALLAPLLEVTDEAFSRALALDAPKLGANDRVHASTCAVHGIDVIVSADRGFDGVSGIERVDPFDEDARRKLLAARTD